MRLNGAFCFEFIGKSMETETTTWSEFPNGGKAIVEQILVSEERKKSKKVGLQESQSEIQVGKCGSNLNYFTLRLIDILTITDFLYFPQFLTQPNLNLQIGF